MGVVGYGHVYWVDQLRAYKPINEIEKSYLPRFLSILEHAHCFERKLLEGHLTGSAFIVDQSKQHVLLMHHAKLNKWLQPGGHCDGNKNILEVAKKEVLEETGIKIKLDAAPIFDIDIHFIPERKGVQGHFHYDIRFLFIIQDNTAFLQNNESLELKWIPISEILNYTEEESILRMIGKI